MTVPKVFNKMQKKHPTKLAFVMDNVQLTFTDVEEISNRVGGYFKGKDLKRGDTVALLMETKPEYACIWLGLAKLGVVTALINTNLRKETLLHSIKVAQSKAIIVGTELAQGKRTPTPFIPVINKINFVAALSDIINDDDIKSLPIYQHYDINQRNDRSKYKLLPGELPLSAMDPRADENGGFISDRDEAILMMTCIFQELFASTMKSINQMVRTICRKK